MDPKVLSVQSDFQKYSREHAELQPLVEKIREYKKLLSDLESTEELLKSGDSELKELAQAELDELKKKKPLLESELKLMMLPVDPRDYKKRNTGDKGRDRRRRGCAVRGRVCFGCIQNMPNPKNGRLS